MLIELIFCIVLVVILSICRNDWSPKDLFLCFKLHVLTTYLYWQPTCIDNLHVMTTYMYWQPTCIDNLHVLTTYMYWQHTWVQAKIRSQFDPLSKTLCNRLHLHQTIWTLCKHLQNNYSFITLWVQLDVYTCSVSFQTNWKKIIWKIEKQV